MIDAFNNPQCVQLSIVVCERKEGEEFYRCEADFIGEKIVAYGRKPERAYALAMLQAANLLLQKVPAFE